MTSQQNEWMKTIEEPALARYLADRVCGRAAGRHEAECVYDAPQDRYFIGCLRPCPSEDERARSGGVQAVLNELLSKLAPMSFGGEVRVQPDAREVGLNIELRWSCYYRVFPRLDKQREYQRHPHAVDEHGDPLSEEADDTDTDELSEDESDEIDRAGLEQRRVPPLRRKRRGSDHLFPKYRKIQCRAVGRVSFVESDGAWSSDVSDLQAECDREIARAWGQILADPEHLRIGQDPDARVRVPAAALESEEAYQKFTASFSQAVLPAWQWQVSGAARAHDLATLAFAFEFTNCSKVERGAWHSEGFLFDVNARFSILGGIVRPFELEVAPKNFRYDRTLLGRGFNCTILRDGSDEQRFVTTATPIFSQQRYQTNAEPVAAFSDLGRDPLPVLRRIRDAMREYDKVWSHQRAAWANQDGWEAAHGAEFDADRQMFADECRRFEEGLEVLERDADARLAFELTNQTFAAGSKKAWRLFQIVFLVSQIPDVVALRTGERRDRDIVDVVYFPTGGGKTEAYLGVIVFHCFFDRLRGKTAGVTVWTRFPLRLLTLQQTQRVADAIGLAELVRMRQADRRLNGPGVDRFAVGYFVGEEATPNELSPPQPGDPDADWSKANDDAARQSWKRIAKCPSCRTASIIVDFDPVKALLLHRCSNTTCAFPGGVLPIHVVDNEIYRFLPSVVVGTIDKLAGLGNQRKFSLILGDVSGRCSQHGYFNGKCCQKDCTDPRRLRLGAPKGVSGPTLFVQDELHLLKEGLGTFDSHYETFLQALLSRMPHSEPIKIIASSATIEAFGRQVEHLYGRQARVFPGSGPTLSSSFYAKTFEHPQRLFVGILPHNKTIFNAVLELIQYYKEETAALQSLSSGPNPFGGRVVPGTSTWQELLDPYVTILTYFSASRELSALRTDLESHVNTELERLRIEPLRLAELSGDTSTDEVTRTLERLETGEPRASAPSAVLATSMISHGVDVDRLNCMFFYGMPKQTAEYIQASSRVGRAHVGIVFTCLKPARERDRSHFEYFDKYHSFLGQLVEPVAINRWSKFSIQRTLPGLFMGVLLQWVANRSGQRNPNRYYMIDFVKQQIADGAINGDMFLPILRDAYLLRGREDAAAEAFGAEVSLRVRQFLDQILAASGQATFVSNALVPPPMRSLRHVDEQVEIELDSNGSDWATKTGR